MAAELEEELEDEELGADEELEDEELGADEELEDEVLGADELEELLDPELIIKRFLLKIIWIEKACRKGR
ncbi:MAG: hypothetical protein WKF77_19825 [Planctomycetaceae bacterium]